MENDPVRTFLLLRGNHLQMLPSEGLSCSQAGIPVAGCLLSVLGTEVHYTGRRQGFRREATLSGAWTSVQRWLSPSSLPAPFPTSASSEGCELGLVPECRQPGMSHAVGWEWPAQCEATRGAPLTRPRVESPAGTPWPLRRATGQSPSACPLWAAHWESKNGK